MSGLSNGVNKGGFNFLNPLSLSSEKVLSCHPELVSGSRNPLIPLDAETSSA
jgi:hypothetical protein